MALKDLSSKYSIASFIVCCVFNITAGFCADGKGSVTNLPLPRFVSLKANEVNLRSGPSSNYPIKLNYRCKNYPLQVVAEFDTWRMLRDSDGSQGWVHSSLISGKRYAVITNNIVTSALPYTIPCGEAILFKAPEEQSYPIARIEIGAIVMLKRCDEHWCNVKVEEYQGWVQKANLWGVQNDELITK